MALILLRHTRPLAADGLCYGLSDLDLAADFAGTAVEIADALPAVDRIVTSPLTRCRRLADQLASGRGLASVVDPRLAEMDFGRWEGRPWDALPRAELDAWAADFDHARPHGGESVAALAARVAAALAEPRHGRTLWVTHSGVVRAACALLRLHQGWDTRLDFGGWLEIDGR